MPWLQKARDHDPEGLRQDDVAHRLRRPQPDGQRRLALAPVDRLDARAVDLGQVGRAVGAEPDDRGRHRRHAEADLGQAEIDDEELGERRRAAEQLDVADRGPRARRAGEPAARASDQTQDHGQSEGAEGDLERDQEALEQDRQEVRQHLDELGPEAHRPFPPAAVERTTLVPTGALS